MKIICEPKDKAGEYSPLAANLYSGCTHGCTYCYVPLATRTDREKFHEAVHPVKNALKRLEADAKELADNKDDREILLSFSCDPYPIIEAEQNITRQAIEILKKNKLRFTVLTKAGKRAEKDFDLLKGYKKASFGTTLVFTSQDDADIWEPNAASLKERRATIKKANKLGIKTWVSIEPVIDPDPTLKLIEKLHSSVDHWKIGKIDHIKELKDKVDLYKFREEVRNLLKRKRKNAKKTGYYCFNRSLTAKDKIEIIPGKRSNILLVATHGVFDDDDNTGIIAKKIATKIGCWAVINEYFHKPINGPSLIDKSVNLNRLEQIKRAEESLNLISPKKTQKGEIQEVKKPKELLELQKYIHTIKEYKKRIAKTHGHALIVWLHGIDDENIDKHSINKSKEDSEDFGDQGQLKELPPDMIRMADILIGYGQGEIPQITCNEKIVADFREILESHKIVAHTAMPGSNYCGNQPDNLNQLFGTIDSNNNVDSIQLEIKYTGFRDYKSLDKTAEALALGLSKLTEIKAEQTVKEIKLTKIKCNTAEEKKYIFRGIGFKINGLIDSIRKEGLLHPIVLMRQKKKHIILCGYRRYQAAKSLGWTNINARIYDAEDLSEQDRLRIAITENGERQDLNKVDIADSLQLIKEQTGLNDNEIAEEYSKLLGIGNSGKTINKYLQLANIQKSSPKIIEAVRKNIIPFGVATDILATMADAKERNIFFEKIALPFKLPRPTLQTVRNYLEKIGPNITKALDQETVKTAISESEKALNPKEAIIAKLGPIAKDPEITKQTVISKAVSTLKKEVFDDDKLQDNLSVASSNVVGGPKEITLQIKLTAENYANMLKKIGKLAEEGKNIKDILDKL